MRAIILSFALLLSAVGSTASAQAQKKANKETEQWRYEVQASVGQAPKGTAIMRVWTYSKNPQVAIMQAGKNAVHGIIFAGIAPTNDKLRLPGVPAIINDPMIETQHAEYFKAFFADGGPYQRYVSFMANGVPDQVIKIGKEYKVGINVTVQVDALRQRLMDDGVLPKIAKNIGKIPTIMVVPSDQWCYEKGYVTTLGEHTYPDYALALRSDKELLQVITVINELFSRRNFPLKNLESTLKNLENQAVENAMMTNKSGAELLVSPIDELKNVAHADIWVQVNWSENLVAGGSKKALSVTMQGLDAYNDKQVAGASGTGNAVFTAQAQTSIMLEELLVGHMEPFAKQLTTYFKTLEEDGRQIVAHVRVFDDFDGDLENDYDGYELGEIIEEWMADNTVKGKFNTVIATENHMLFENVCIPLQNDKGRDMDARRWMRELQRMLRDEYEIESKLTTKGLGEATLILGSK